MGMAASLLRLSVSEYIRQIVVPDAKRVVAAIPDTQPAGVARSGPKKRGVKTPVRAFRVSEEDWGIIERSAALLRFSTVGYVRRVVLADAAKVIELLGGNSP